MELFPGLPVNYTFSHSARFNLHSTLGKLVSIFRCGVCSSWLIGTDVVCEWTNNRLFLPISSSRRNACCEYYWTSRINNIPYANLNASLCRYIVNEISNSIAKIFDSSCSHISKQTGSNSKKLWIKPNIEQPHRCIHHQKCYTNIRLREKHLNAVEH